MLKCFQQRTRAPEHHDVRVVFEPRPANRLLLHEVDRELDVHRGLETGAGDFAFALARVAVAHEQQRARLVHRKHQLHAGVHSGVIHVAAICAGNGREDRFPARGRDRDASEHRPQRQLEDRRLDVG